MPSTTNLELPTWRSFWILAGVLSLIFVIVFFLAVMGVWDEKEYKFTDKQDAIEENFFAKGWLPDFIPKSATNIVVLRNIDIYISEGGFMIDLAEIDNFIRVLSMKNTNESRLGQPSNYKELKEQGYESFDCSHEGTAWIFMINKTTGDCRYWSSRY